MCPVSEVTYALGTFIQKKCKQNIRILHIVNLVYALNARSALQNRKQQRMHRENYLLPNM